MADPFIAEIRIFPFNFAPRYWAFCDGQLLNLAQNTALFSLLGTTYGGNGQTNFGLPNLQGSAPLGAGQGPGLSQYQLGQSGGSQTVTLLQQQVPPHAHPVSGISAAASLPSPANNLSAAGAGRTPPQMFQSNAPNTPMNPTSAAGGNQPHNNMQPYTAFNFCIALQGVYPPRS